MSANASLFNVAQSLHATFQGVGNSSSAFENGLVDISKRTMGHLANPILGQIGLTKDTKEPVILLDNCCGTGVVRQEVEKTLSREVLDKSNFLCADYSAGLVELVKQRIAAEGWVNTEARTLDAMDSGLPDDSFTHIVIALGLHITPDPTAILNDSKRILKTGGYFGSTTFHHENADIFWVSDMRAAFASFPFDAPFPDKFPMQVHSSGDWTSPSWIEEHFKEQGFKDVEVRVVTGTLQVAGVDDFVKTWLVMLPMVMKTWWSEELRSAHSLEEVKDLIAKYLREKYGDETWSLTFKTINASGHV